MTFDVVAVRDIKPAELPGQWSKTTVTPSTVRWSVRCPEPDRPI